MAPSPRVVLAVSLAIVVGAARSAKGVMRGRALALVGDVDTLAGTAGVSGYADGSGTAARFNYPKGVAIDSAAMFALVVSGSMGGCKPRTNATFLTNSQTGSPTSAT